MGFSGHIISCSDVQRSSQNGGILSRLALHFPHIFSFWGRHNQQQVSTGKQTEVMSSDDIDERTNRIASDNIDSNVHKYYEELESAMSINLKLPASRFYLYLTSHLFFSFSLFFYFFNNPAVSPVLIFASEL